MIKQLSCTTFANQLSKNVWQFFFSTFHNVLSLPAWYSRMFPANMYLLPHSFEKVKLKVGSFLLPLLPRSGAVPWGNFKTSQQSGALSYWICNQISQFKKVLVVLKRLCFFLCFYSQLPEQHSTAWVMGCKVVCLPRPHLRKALTSSCTHAHTHTHKSNACMKGHTCTHK